MTHTSIDSLKAPPEVRCKWEFRETHFVGNVATVANVYVCLNCKSWTANYPYYKYRVCPSKDRRTAKADRRRHV